MSRASGLLVATLTPFDSAGRVDLGVVRAHSQWLVESGIQGLCPCGTTGEWLYLSVGEKARIIQAVVTMAGRQRNSRCSRCAPTGDFVRSFNSGKCRRKWRFPDSYLLPRWR